MDAVNAGMAKETEGCLRLQLALFCLLVFVQTQGGDCERRCSVFCEENYCSEMKINKCRPTKKRPLCFIDDCQIPNFPYKVWFPEPLYLYTPNIVISH